MSLRPFLPFAAGLSLALASLAASPALAQHQAQTVTITLTGVQAQRGGTLGAVLATRDEFMRGGSYRLRETPGGESVVLTFENVAPGDYAFMVMHDENGNNRLDMGDRGPTEGWAMSNGANLEGYPTFDAQKFTVGTGPVTLTVPMHY
jgi:Uncharacterized protein conserved in bacteria